MTGTYDWNPMPHKVEMACPSCGGLSIFEFAEIVKIGLKKDVPFFEESKLFEYEMFKDSCGHKWHGAIYYPGLHGGTVNAIRDLPEGYEPDCWSHSVYLYRGHGLDVGSVRCTECMLIRKHTLTWPEEAYYSITFKSSHLWAFNRESIIDLRDYIASNERNVDSFRWRNFLLHIPTVFKKQNARDYVVKKINDLLSC